MKTAQEIYDTYRIMPSLALHQLRVAAVAKTICDAINPPVDSHAVISACLLHDMANIIKSDLDTFPQFLEPQGFEYWRAVKEEYIAKYGSNEHHAALQIAGEIGVSDSVLRYMDGIGFSKMPKTRAGDSYEQKIAQYGDSRVGPHGVTSTRERLEEARKRYLNRGYDMPRDRDSFEENVQDALEIEKQIFERLPFAPEDISDESLQATIEALRAYPIVT